MNLIETGLHNQNVIPFEHTVDLAITDLLTYCFMSSIKNTTLFFPTVMGSYCASILLEILSLSMSFTSKIVTQWINLWNTSTQYRNSIQLFQAKCYAYTNCICNSAFWFNFQIVYNLLFPSLCVFFNILDLYYNNTYFTTTRITS